MLSQRTEAWSTESRLQAAQEVFAEWEVGSLSQGEVGVSGSVQKGHCDCALRIEVEASLARLTAWAIQSKRCFVPRPICLGEQLFDVVSFAISGAEYLDHCAGALA